MSSRLGVGPLERPWLWIALVLLVHSAAFVAFSQEAWLVRDEILYVKQAAVFAHGRTTAEAWDAGRGAFVAEVPSAYPVGTSLLMALPVRAFGPRGALLVPWLASIVLVIATGVWLQRAGYSPLFALLTLTYPPTLVFSRLAMSDVPSAAVVACALLLFARGAQRPAASAWLGAGLLCGASLCLRETNPLVLLPLFVGALLRRERHAWVLLVGTVLGAGLRPLSSLWLFGDPLFYKPIGGFSASALVSHLPIYLFAALCYVPGGLYWVLRYRGPRRAEIVSTVVGFIALYAAYYYAGSPSGALGALLLAPRYLIPLTPLFALGAAAAFAAWRARAERATPRTISRLLIAGTVAACVLTTAVAAGIAAHAASQRSIESAISAHVGPDDVVVTNVLATDKLLFGVGHEKIISLSEIADLRRVIGLGESVFVLVLDRDDSAFWRAMGVRNDQLLRTHAARVPLAPVFETTYPGGERLRIHRARAD